MADPKVLIIDGFDTSDLDLIVEKTNNWRTGEKRTKKRQQIPNEHYAVSMANVPTGGERKLLVRGAVISVDRATFETNIDELMWRLYQTQKIAFVDRPAGAYRGELEGEPRVTGLHPEMIQRAVRITIPFTCEDPRWYEDTLQNVAFTTATQMPLGNAPVHPIIEVDVGTFTLTYSGGGSMAIVGAPSPPITIDMFNKTILNSLSATMYDPAIFVSGDFFALDPDDGTFPGGPWATLATSAGNGTCKYNKASRG